MTPWTVACQAPHGDSPGKNTGVGCHALLQGIFLTQGLNPGLPHCRGIFFFFTIWAIRKVHFLLFGTLHKLCTFLHHNLVSEDWLYCGWMRVLKFMFSKSNRLYGFCFPCLILRSFMLSLVCDHSLYFLNSRKSGEHMFLLKRQTTRILILFFNCLNPFFYFGIFTWVIWYLLAFWIHIFCHWESRVVLFIFF